MLPILFGAAQAWLGIFQGIAQANAQKQEYANQVAFQKVNGEFAGWQARFNAKATDTNNQYQYWQQTVNHNQSLAYTHAQRNVELLKSVKQAEVVGKTRAAAGASYVVDSNALSQQYSEASMQEAVALQQYKWRALQGRASVQAMAMEGNSVDRLVNDYARQLGDYETLQSINENIRTRQYNREQAGQVAQYLSRWQSQSHYDEQTFFDPIAPFAPLPTLIQPPPPSMTGAKPSGLASALNIGTSIMGGINAGISFQGQLNGLKTPSGSSGSGTGGSR